jgi:hypothetical protein
VRRIDLDRPLQHVDGFVTSAGGAQTHAEFVQYVRRVVVAFRQGLDQGQRLEWLAKEPARDTCDLSCSIQFGVNFENFLGLAPGQYRITVQ